MFRNRASAMPENTPFRDRTFIIGSVFKVIMEGIEIDTFIQSLKHEYENLKAVMDKEPFLERTLLMLSMATAVNCMDWSEPRKTLDACIDSIRSITEYAVKLIDKWAPEGRFVFSKEEIPQDEWNQMFMNAQSMANELLRLHMDTFGSDTEEKILHAYNETIFCLTYMISTACARSLNPDECVNYSIECLNYVFDFINENCKRVEM